MYLNTLILEKQCKSSENFYTTKVFVNRKEVTWEKIKELMHTKNKKYCKLLFPKFLDFSFKNILGIGEKTLSYYKSLFKGGNL